MNITAMVGAIIGLTVTVIIVSTVLLPTISNLNLDPTYTTLMSVVGTLGVIIPVMMAVRLISGRSD